MLDELLRFVPPHLHQEYLRLLSHVPDYAKNVCVVGESCAALGYLLKKRPGVAATGITGDPRGAAIAAELLDAVVSRPGELDAIPDQSLDAILCCNVEKDLAVALGWIEALGRKIHENAHVFALHGAPEPSPDIPSGAARELGERVSTGLAAAGYQPYTEWPLSEAGAGGLRMAVPASYDPIRHAKSLRARGWIESSYSVLESIPPSRLQDAAVQTAADLESLETLAAWIARELPSGVTHLLSRAQNHFYALADRTPRLAEAYLHMARCWQHTGEYRMARRLLRSIHFATSDAGAAARIAELEGLPDSPPTHDVEAPPWNPRAMRVLFLMHPRPHFGLDALYDGLCACLGDENVVEYPWKPTLHGRDIEVHRNYPCRFNRAGEPRVAAQLADALGGGEFDVVLYGDVEGDIPLADVQMILAARGSTPVYLVDALDQMANFRTLAQERLRLEAFAGCFKREMLWCADYGPDCWPLPFACAPPESAIAASRNRTNPFFWAGHRMFGHRRLYLEALEARYGWDLNAHFDQETYRRHIANSRIGLNCFGMGFDTVRYWELPAHGCLLLSERLPIRIPHNFQDGVHAVFFDDLADLAEKLDFYLAHEAEAGAIAEAGHQHFLAWHTNEARARQLLGWIDQNQAG